MRDFLLHDILLFWQDMVLYVKRFSMSTNIGIFGGSTELGGTLLGKDTYHRCTEAVTYIRRNDLRNIVIYLCAGRSPRYPRAPKLAEVMMEYLKFNLYDEVEKRNITFRITKDNPWSTWNETIAMNTMLTADQQKRILIFSCWYHIPRIGCIWKLIKSNCTPIFIKVPHEFDFQLIREVAAWMKLPFRLAFG